MPALGSTGEETASQTATQPPKINPPRKNPVRCLRCVRCDPHHRQAGRQAGCADGCGASQASTVGHDLDLWILKRRSSIIRQVLPITYLERRPVLNNETVSCYSAPHSHPTPPPTTMKENEREEGACCSCSHRVAEILTELGALRDEVGDLSGRVRQGEVEARKMDAWRRSEERRRFRVGVEKNIDLLAPSHEELLQRNEEEPEIDGELSDDHRAGTLRQLGVRMERLENLLKQSLATGRERSESYAAKAAQRVVHCELSLFRQELHQEAAAYRSPARCGNAKPLKADPILPQSRRLVPKEAVILDPRGIDSRAETPRPKQRPHSAYARTQSGARVQQYRHLDSGTRIRQRPEAQPAPYIPAASTAARRFYRHKDPRPFLRVSHFP
jgi:hypothetical protein